tara:strand:- start:3282 stop:4967 length:1686 start_codon:yes stop_codon:yes gene_type:complete
MENRNVLIAIVLSSLVLIFWATFFQPPPVERKVDEQKITQNQETGSPSVDENQESIANEITRDEIISSTKRIKLENQNIKGSISLTGAVIDDVTFKNYNENVNGEEKIVFLNPKNSPKEYFIETGWAVGGDEKVKLPLVSTIWKTVGNNVLTPNNPVTLEWNNGEGLIFTKKIELDDKFLFKITQEIKNNSNKAFQFYPYAQINRKGKPEGREIYILHLGFLGVFDDELIEESVDDIAEEKFTINSSTGWLGITDKYWLTALVPEKNSEFKAEFVANNEKYRANYIIKNSKILNPGSSINNEIKTFVGAKEISVIDNYAERFDIKKFDLTINFGWFYFIVKPLFFVTHYFFELTGNFGLAIIMLTACARIILFPLANYSFRSMAKMKVLQPEIERIKSLNKSDKVKLQQETMALFKKERVNPLSGCLVILPSIPLFFSIYKMLYISIEMRHQPFYGWISDLSERDPTSLFNLFGLIPWDPPTFLMIGGLPILFGISMHFQTLLNPSVSDPMQRKLFQLMPIFLTVILAGFPSGLCLYWCANNCLSMIQQWFIMKRTTVKTV